MQRPYLRTHIVHQPLSVSIFVHKCNRKLRNFLDSALKATEETRKVYDHDWKLIYVVTITATELITALTVSSPTTADKPLVFTSALHTYVRLPEHVLPTQVTIESLKGLKYLDKVLGGSHVESAQRVIYDGPQNEIDRIYYDSPKELTLDWNGGGVKLVKENFPDVVVGTLNSVLVKSC